jgi:chaperone modulatory protein CbpM
MTKKTPPAQLAEIVDEASIYSLEDLCRTCNVQIEWITELMEHGVVEPEGRVRAQWRFSSVSAVRVAKAKRLQRDLGLNAAGVALAFDLLAQIQTLNDQIRALHERGFDSD